MSKNHAKLDLGGIKCDAPWCDYEDEIVDLSYEDKQVLLDYVGTPCPKCGSNLLTQEDADTIFKMQAYVAGINAVAELLNLPEPKDEGAYVSIPLSMNGSGEVELKEEDEDDKS